MLFKFDMIIVVKIKGKLKKVKVYIFGIFIDVFYNYRFGKCKGVGYVFFLIIFLNFCLNIVCILRVSNYY